MNKKFERRDLIKGMCLSGTLFAGVDPVSLMFKGVLSGLLRNVEAQEVGELINYIGLVESGGVPSWLFSCPLTPNGMGNDDFAGTEVNPMLGNRFKNAGTTRRELEHAEHRIGKYYFPWIWSAKVMSSAGAAINLSELANHLFVLRGIGHDINGHERNQIKSVRPVDSAPSLSGLVADKGGRPISALFWKDSFGYKSAKGLSALDLFEQRASPLDYVVSPFKRQNDYKFTNSEVNSMVDNFLARLKDARSKNLPDAEVLYKNRENAIALLRKSFSGLRDEYLGLRNKYFSVQQKTLFANPNKIIGINDRAYSCDQTDARYGVDNYTFKANDINDLLYEDGRLGKHTCVQFLAENLAISEFLLREKISSSFTSKIDGHTPFNFGNLRYDVKTGELAPASKQGLKALPVDAHTTGSLLHMWGFSIRALLMGACLTEFTNKLKSMSTGKPGENVFDKTVIHLASDFSRSPRADELGSDHAWQGSSLTVISGMIKEPTVTGNIETQKKVLTTENHPGSWGLAGPVSALQGRTAGHGTVASTMAEFLKVPTPAPNDMSAVSVQEDNVISLFGEPKNISKESA